MLPNIIFPFPRYIYKVFKTCKIDVTSLNCKQLLTKVNLNSNLYYKLTYSTHKGENLWKLTQLHPHLPDADSDKKKLINL